MGRDPDSSFIAKTAPERENLIGRPPDEILGLVNRFDASYLPSPLDMSWKRAQLHAESMLGKLGIGPGLKGKKDLRGKKAIFFDDGANPYRAMCFTVAAKILKRRGAEVESTVPALTEAPHVKIIDLPQQPKPGIQRPRSRR